MGIEKSLNLTDLITRLETVPENPIQILDETIKNEEEKGYWYLREAKLYKNGYLKRDLIIARKLKELFEKYDCNKELLRTIVAALKKKDSPVGFLESNLTLCLDTKFDKIISYDKYNTKLRDFLIDYLLTNECFHKKRKRLLNYYASQEFDALIKYYFEEMGKVDMEPLEAIMTNLGEIVSETRHLKDIFVENLRYLLSFGKKTRISRKKSIKRIHDLVVSQGFKEFLYTAKNHGDIQKELFKNSTYVSHMTKDYTDILIKTTLNPKDAGIKDSLMNFVKEYSSNETVCSTIIVIKYHFKFDPCMTEKFLKALSSEKFKELINYHYNSDRSSSSHMDLDHILFNMCKNLQSDEEIELMFDILTKHSKRGIKDLSEEMVSKMQYYCGLIDKERLTRLDRIMSDDVLNEFLLNCKNNIVRKNVISLLSSYGLSGFDGPNPLLNTIKLLEAYKDDHKMMVDVISMGIDSVARDHNRNKDVWSAVNEWFSFIIRAEPQLRKLSNDKDISIGLQIIDGLFDYKDFNYKKKYDINDYVSLMFDDKVIEALQKYNHQNDNLNIYELTEKIFNLINLGAYKLKKMIYCYQPDAGLLHKILEKIERSENKPLLMDVYSSDGLIKLTRQLDEEYRLVIMDLMGKFDEKDIKHKPEDTINMLTRHSKKPAINIITEILTDKNKDLLSEDGSVTYSLDQKLNVLLDPDFDKIAEAFRNHPDVLTSMACYSIKNGGSLLSLYSDNQFIDIINKYLEKPGVVKAMMQKVYEASPPSDTVTIMLDEIKKRLVKYPDERELLKDSEILEIIKEELSRDDVGTRERMKEIDATELRSLGSSILRLRAYPKLKDMDADEEMKFMGEEGDNHMKSSRRIGIMQLVNLFYEESRYREKDILTEDILGIFKGIERYVATAKYESEVVKFIEKDISHKEDNAGIDLNKRILRILNLNECRSLDEVAECAKIDLSRQGYNVVCRLGFGGSGRVYKVKSIEVEELNRIEEEKQNSSHESSETEDVIFKVKIHDPNSKQMKEKFGREGTIGIIKAFKKFLEFNHPNIVHYRGVPFRYDNKVVVIEEYVDGGSIQDYLDGNVTAKDKEGNNVDVFSQFSIDDIFFGILNGVEFLHSEKKLILRDIKLENILISPHNKIVKIDDFETVISEKELEERIKEHDGKLEREQITLSSDRYHAPELMRTNIPSKKTDIYALGACLLYMLRKEKRVYNEKGEIELWPLKEINLLEEGSYNRELEAIVKGLPYEKFLLKALAYGPEDRFADVEDMMFAFKHNLPFDKGCLLFANWSESTNKAMRRFLGEEGFDVITTTTMEETIKMYERKKPAIIICNPVLYDIGDSQLESIKCFFDKVMQNSPETIFYYIGEGNHTYEIGREIIPSGAGMLYLGSSIEKISAELKEALINGKPTKPTCGNDSVQTRFEQSKIG